MSNKQNKKQLKKKNQKGGDPDPQQINLWGQDQAPPGSYKIQLGYIDIPKTIKFDERWMDTPYRFKSFHDANAEATRIFDGYSYRIIASNDRPYWDAPSYLHQNRNTLKPGNNQHWYDVVGIEPITENPYASYSPQGQIPKLSPERQYALSQLSKLQLPIQGAEIEKIKKQK
jgi:hypothetical protein